MTRLWTSESIYSVLEYQSESELESAIQLVKGQHLAKADELARTELARSGVVDPVARCDQERAEAALVDALVRAEGPD